MRRTHGRTVDITTVAEFDQRLAAGARSLSGWRVRALDLRGRAAGLRDGWPAGAAFLGCTFDPGVAEELESRGALVLPEPQAETSRATHGSSGVLGPGDRPGLYTADELYDTDHWRTSVDGLTFAWSQRETDDDAERVRALHDHAIDGALELWREGRRIVGVMGGHGVGRDDPAYADAARLGRLLADPSRTALTVATGGGPGAMEAANLGARLAGYEPGVLDEAIGVLGGTPSFRPSIDAWVTSAREVCRRWPDPVASLGVPTWHFGHEPPGLFPTAIAKYFRNAVREAVLLEVCEAGIVFLPGAAGTVQEVFQDACENYYADEDSVAPMVLVGRGYWTETLPAWPLLQALARDRELEHHLHLVDRVEDAVAVLAA